MLFSTGNWIAMKVLVILVLLFSIRCPVVGQPVENNPLPLASAQGSVSGGPAASETHNLYNFTLNDIEGKTVPLSQFQGKVALLVNVASRCGFTGQYEGLQKLYEKYSPKGFVILGFPANDFLGQEPGTDAEIKTFCTRNYGVSFPMFSKISVSGDSQHPLYKFLTEKETNPDFPGAISWNFNKFLISRHGKILGRFGSMTSPDSSALVQAVEKALQEQ